MNKISTSSIICLFVVFFVLFSICFPTFSIGQEQGGRVTDSSVRETNDSNELLRTSDSLLKGQTNDGRAFNAEAESTEPSENTVASRDEQAAEASAVETATQETRADSKDILHAVVVTDWELFRDKNGARESLTKEPKTNAEPNQAYNFSFGWMIASDKLGRNLLPGDYFQLDIPQNDDRSTGHWYAMTGEWNTVTTEDGSESVYRYRIENSADGKTQVIRIEFLDGVDKLHINTLDSELNFSGFMNYVTKEGVQDVHFGQDGSGTGISKSITFNQIALKASNGFSYKFGAAGSNNSLKWGIQFNGAANLELSGDEVDYDVNGGAESEYQGFYREKPDRDVWHPWGTNYTDVFAPIGKEAGGDLGGYVEDELPVGAEMTSMTIAAYIPIPIGLTQENYARQEGVYSSTTAAYQSFVLADYGNGPTYRDASDDSEVQQPKTGTGFSLLTQESTETKSQFKTRIQSAPYQYGVYKENAGVSTVMIHYGSLKKANNEQEKLSDLTNEAYTGRTITNPKSGQMVQITQVAAKAADYSIKRGYYAEEDRELLENYYSITYGDSNVIGGRATSYNISFTVRYPPATPSGPVQNESAIYTHSALTLNRTVPEEMPKRDKGTANLQNPYGSITLNANQVLLQKFDVERDEEDAYIPINGAEFKLQVKDGATWTDVKKDGELLLFETEGIKYFEIENGITVEKTANGLVKADFAALGLSNGTYRFVENRAAAGYDAQESPNWVESEQAVISDSFAIPSTTSRGPTVTVWNKKLPQATYAVEHYIQNSEGNTAKENFKLYTTINKSGYLGEEVVGEPLMELLGSYQYDRDLSDIIGKTTGTVTEDGSLTLQLYYTIAAEVPFTLYKQGMDGKMMPSVDLNGSPLVDEQGREMKVAFDIYEWDENWDTSNPYEPGNGPVAKPNVWTKINDEPIATDALGRIRVPEITDLTKHYAIVEVETYPDYVLAYNAPPADLTTYREVYWVVRMSTNLIFSAPSWAHGTEVDKPEFETPSESNDNRYILKNRKPEISLFKVNEQNEAMPSANQQKVQFDIYRWTGGGYFHENYAYNKSPWEKLTTGTTDNQGFFGKIGQTGLNGDENKNYDWYIIHETETYSGYQLPEGYWLVKTAWNPTTQQFEIFEVKYKVGLGDTAVDGEDPGHAISDDRKSLYLTNKTKPISFYKEDGNQNPLGGVHFSLYKTKEGEEGTTGSEDPEASDTKWDMANPIEKISSTNASDKGKVTFEGLARGDYLLMETQTLAGYQLPLGYWIVTVDFYGEIETVKGRGDPLPPAFRIEDDTYYLPNYQKNSLPRAGGSMRVLLLIIGIVTLGFAILIGQNKQQKNKGEKKMKKLFSKLITILFVLATTLGGAASVLAAPGTRPTNGDLTIHKYWAETSSAIGDEGDGTKLATEPTNPAVEGIQFDVYEITTNDSSTPDTPPSDKDGWTYSRNGLELTVKKDSTEYKYTLVLIESDAGPNGKTDTTGELKYTDLPAGYYYVEENLAESTGYKVQGDGNGGKTITSAAKPFIVAVPMTNSAGNGWNTDVHVYPKNQGLNPDKEPDVPSINVGDKVNWTITANVPSDIGAYQKFDVIDELDKRLNFVDGSVKVVGLDASGNELIPLINPNDFEMTHSSATADAKEKIVVSLTAAGIAKLAATDGIEKVAISFDTTVNGNINSDEENEIKNDATIEFDNGSTTDSDKTPISEVHTGEIFIDKKDSDGTTELKGAEFQVALTDTDAIAGDFLKVKLDSKEEYIVDILKKGDAGYNSDDAFHWVVRPHEENSNSVDLGNKIFYATSFEGIQTHEVSNGTTTWKSYWIAETKAPADYNLLDAPVKVTFDGTNENKYHVLTETIVNKKGFTLPNTGGIGTILLVVFGIILIGLAIILTMNKKKKTV